MQTAVNLWPLIGVAVIIVGFVLRFNPMLIVAVAAVVTALTAHFSPLQILDAIGNGFIKTRNIPLIILLPLAVIGLLERHGLRERAQRWIASIKAATAGRLLIVYLLVRELTAAVGLTGLGGHPQMVRPLIAPMTEGAAESRYGTLTDAVRYRLRAFAAATDNVGLFFGEDIFVAFGAIVLMTTFLREAGIEVEPIHVAVWGIPTAICALLVHGFRLYLLDRKLDRELGHVSGQTPGQTLGQTPAQTTGGESGRSGSFNASTNADVNAQAEAKANTSATAAPNRPAAPGDQP